MVTTILTITSLVTLIAAVYFAYGKKTTDVKLQDYIAKYESVKSYAETLTKSAMSASKTTKTSKPAKATKEVSAPKKRGRKPTTK